MRCERRLSRWSGAAHSYTAARVGGEARVVSGRQRFIVVYFCEDVLAGLSGHLLHFSLHARILLRLCASPYWPVSGLPIAQVQNAP